MEGRRTLNDTHMCYAVETGQGVVKAAIHHNTEMNKTL